ncbi:MAG: hypothetical protein IPG04_27570 [Polyangiaceae bacterium]|nr:hypothetical protein [Polyangiaceae bacterium]
MCESHDVIALGRSVPTTNTRPAVDFRRCDLYDVEQAANALEGATAAVYLVHSMLPSARSEPSAAAPLGSTAPAASKPRSTANRAVSLQRFPNAKRLRSRQLAELYFEWLPSALKPILRVIPLADGGCAISIAGWPRPLLELSLDGAASGEDRTVYRISGGDLVAPTSLGKGTLEFRTVLGGSELIALVSDFEPRLPWFIYSWTQAVLHLWVMRAFGRYLARTTNA